MPSSANFWREWDIRFYSDFLNVRLKVQCRFPNENWNNNGLNILNSGKFNTEAGLFLKLANLFHLDIMITYTSHVNKEAFSYFFLNDAEIWFGGIKNAVDLNY